MQPKITRDWGGLLATFSAFAILATFVWVYMESRFVARYGLKKRNFIAWKLITNLVVGTCIYIFIHYFVRNWIA